MILTILEYAKRFPSKGKILSSKTIARRCADGLLPSHHIARQLPGDQGQWVIDVPDEIIEKGKTKSIIKTSGRSLNTKHFNW